MSKRRRWPFRTRKIGKVTCPACGKEQDRATGLNAAVPKPGAVMICRDCGAVNIWEGDRLRAASDAEKFRLYCSDQGPMVDRVIDLIRQQRKAGT